MKIAVSIGHTLTGIGSGAIGYLNESNVNRIVGAFIKKFLEQLGHTVIFLQIDKSTVSGYDFKTRTKLANEAKVDLFVEIHFNAGGGRGTEVLAKSKTGKEYAQKIVNEIAALGFVNRGVKDGSRLYVINNTNAPAVLVECCFVDNKEDIERYNPELMAKAIVKGITGQVVLEVKQPKEQYGVVTASKLNVRDEANTDGKIITTIKNGDKIKILQVSGDWYNIEYKNQGAWVNKAYVKLV